MDRLPEQNYLIYSQIAKLRSQNLFVKRQFQWRLNTREVVSVKDIKPVKIVATLVGFVTLLDYAFGWNYVE
jgi:hypothetical protein